MLLLGAALGQACLPCSDNLLPWGGSRLSCQALRATPHLSRRGLLCQQNRRWSRPVLDLENRVAAKCQRANWRVPRRLRSPGVPGMSQFPDMAQSSSPGSGGAGSSFGGPVWTVQPLRSYRYWSPSLVSLTDDSVLST